MASRTFSKIQAFEKEIKVLFEKITIGASGAPTITANKYGSTITRNSAGDYTLTLADKYYEFKHMDINLISTTLSKLGFQIKSETVATDGKINFYVKTLAPVDATLTVDAAIKFHSQLPGADGNDVTVALTDAVSAGSEAVASVSDAGAIVINIEDGVSTAAQVHAAIMDSDLDLADEARNFIASEVLVGATAINAAVAANLAGGLDAAVATDPANGDVLRLAVHVKNSSV